jgi:hypothetical protein
VYQINFYLAMDFQTPRVEIRFKGLHFMPHFARLFLLFSCVFLTACSAPNFAKDLDFPELKWPKFFSKSTVPANDPSLNTFTSQDCPALILQPDLVRFQEYTNPTQPSQNSKISETVLTKVEALCQIQSIGQKQNEGQNVVVRLTLEFQGALGAQGLRDAKVEANYSYPYFVAVIAPTGEILSKDVFAVSLTYKAGQSTQKFTDILQQTIPLPPSISPQSYQIMVGFQLSPAELALNRRP